MEGLTKRQREIVDFIEAYIAEKRHNPSYRDIKHHFGFSSLGSVYNHIQSLKKKGLLPKDTRSCRSLALTVEPKINGIEIPLIGKLKGGMPIETFPQVSMVFLPPSMVPTAASCYLLRVVGSELEEESIKEGDLLLVQTKHVFQEGETVLAQVGGQTTFVKKAIRDFPYIRLESSNPQVQPLVLREDHVQIFGIIVALIRHY